MRRIATAATLLAFPAMAQASDIIVTGAGLGAGAGDTAYNVVTIDRARLADSASGRLEDVLREAAGFQQFRRSDARSAHPTSQGATLRGLGGNASSRALVLLDGVPLTDPFGGWISWAAYDPSRLGLVRVTRGGGSGVFGPGAIAGTIELMSAGPGQTSALSAGAAYGSRDSVEADLGLSAALSGGFASFSANYARGDGFTPIVEASRGPIDRPARYEQASAAGRAVIPVGDETELQASALLMVDRRDRGLPFTDNRNVGADASVRIVGRGRWGWEALAYVQLREFLSEFASVDAARTTATQTLDQYNVPATGLGGRLELRPPVGERFELRLGADGRRTEGRTRELFTFVAGAPTRRREAGGETVTLGGFAEASYSPSDTVTITGGGRIDRWWIDNGFLRTSVLATGATLADNVFPNRSGWEPTGRAGIAIKPTGAVTLRAAGYLGWRLPTLNELYRPFRVGNDQTNANDALKPERLKGVDAGIDFRPIESVRLGGTLFHNRLDGAIANVTLTSTSAGVTRQRQNLDAIRSQGFELNASIQLAPWYLAAAYSYVEAKVRSSGPALALDGLRPAQTPKHHGSATLGWRSEDGPSAAVTLRYVGRQFEDDQNVRALDDALTVDAVARMPVMDRLEIELRGENLANARVEAGMSGANIIERATPRTLWVGLRYAR
jgi:outer membrane receptor protein involved in Fe transport